MLREMVLLHRPFCWLKMDDPTRSNNVFDTVRVFCSFDLFITAFACFVSVIGTKHRFYSSTRSSDVNFIPSLLHAGEFSKKIYFWLSCKRSKMISSEASAHVPKFTWSTEHVAARYCLELNVILYNRYLACLRLSDEDFELTSLVCEDFVATLVPSSNLPNLHNQSKCAIISRKLVPHPRKQYLIILPGKIYNYLHHTPPFSTL